MGKVEDDEFAQIFGKDTVHLKKVRKPIGEESENDGSSQEEEEQKKPKKAKKQPSKKRQQFLASKKSTVVAPQVDKEPQLQASNYFSTKSVVSAKSGGAVKQLDNLDMDSDLSESESFNGNKNDV